jgi:hypothetical protein
MRLHIQRRGEHKEELGLRNQRKKFPRLRKPKSLKIDFFVNVCWIQNAVRKAEAEVLKKWRRGSSLSGFFLKIPTPGRLKTVCSDVNDSEIFENCEKNEWSSQTIGSLWLKMIEISEFTDMLSI